MKNQNIILFGSYRSGTTWLMQIFSTGINRQFNFEPLEPSHNPKVSEFKLRNKYLAPDKSYDQYNFILNKIINGKIKNSYIKAMSNNPMRLYRWKFWAQNQVVKFVQGHLIIGYLHKKLGASNIVHIIRNPFAVIESLKHKYWWSSDLEEFLDSRQTDLFVDYPELENKLKKSFDMINNKYLIGSLRKTGLTAIRWCLENYVPLVQKYKKGYDYRILYYEEFYNHPLRELKRISTYFNIEFNNKIRKKINTPSITTNKESGVHDNNYSPLNKWKYNLKTEEKEVIQRILNIFKINNLLDKNYNK